jgi:hypothetical protein
METTSKDRLRMFCYLHQLESKIDNPYLGAWSVVPAARLHNQFPPKHRKATEMKRIAEISKTLYGLMMFTIKSLYILISDSMKKESQTYKEEREEQKKIAKNRIIKEGKRKR